MSIGELLADIWLFSGMDSEHLEKLATFAFTKSFQTGETILEKGRSGNGLYVIVSGQVEVVETTQDEGERRLATLGPREFFGEMALLDDQPRSATVKALEDTTCVGIDRWLFLSQLQRDPEISISMLRTMAQRIRQADAKLSQ